MLKLSVPLLAVTVIMILSSCSGKPPDNGTNDREEWNVKGNVRSLTEIAYSPGGKYVTKILFNTDGNVLEQTAYNPDGSLIRKWIYQYDGRNRKMNRNCYVLNDSLSYTIRYYYNEQGKVESVKVFKSDGIFKSQTTFEYDKNLNITRECAYGENERVENLILSRFNENNKIEEKTFIDSVLHKQWSQIYKYNSRGLVKEISYFWRRDSLLKKTDYVYSINNKVKKIYSYDPEMKPVSITAYRYDKQGNSVEISEFLAKDKTQKKRTFGYRYDKYGNWTFHSENVNDRIENIITREIEYF